ncbi:fluoride efflux transporter CrcB [Thermostilla marina]
MWQTILIIAAAGACGTVCRYLLATAAQNLTGSADFPWGTLTVNALGCFLFGLIWMLAEDRLLISGHTRFIVLTGFMGAFTTFSTFAFETGQFLRDAQYGAALANLTVQNVLGLACVFLGIAVGKML